MHLKHTVVALAAAGLLSVQAHAGEMPVEAAIQPAQTAAAFTDADLQALFEASDEPMQLAALSGQEMRETAGALNPFLGRMIIGGFGGAVSSVISQWDFNRGWRGYQTVNWAKVGGAAAALAGVGAWSRAWANRGWF